MAKSGLLMMLEAFGLKIDPVEIQAQIGAFKGLAESIDNRLAIIMQQNAAIMAALNIGETPHAEKPAGQIAGGEQASDTAPGIHGQADRPDAGTADGSVGKNAEQV